jgi:hypothetical protein
MEDWLLSVRVGRAGTGSRAHQPRKALHKRRPKRPPISHVRRDLLRATSEKDSIIYYDPALIGKCSVCEASAS